MDFLFFDNADNMMFIRNDAISAKYTVETMTHTGKFPEDDTKPIERGMRVGWIDDFGLFQYFEIRSVERLQPENTISYTAEHIVISELTDVVIGDKRSYNTTAVSALTHVLEDTNWELGNVNYNPTTKGTNFYYISVWEAVLKVQKTWKVCLTPRLSISQNYIVHRYIDISARRGAYRGLRLTLDRNVSSAGIEYNDSNLRTALIGRGRGEQTESGGFGRRITFEDISWSVLEGDPVNKPLGQKYVELTDLTEIFGRDGQPRIGVVEFAQIDDPEELLEATYEKLLDVAKVDVSIKLTVASLRKLGYTNEGLQYGDTVDVIIDPWGLAQQADVVGLTYDLVYPENTKPIIGGHTTQDIKKRTIRISAGADIASRIADNNSGLLDGYIDAAKTRIMSSGTNRNTLNDGSEIYIASDGNSAVLFTGAGILLADEKDPNGEWLWRTAIDGNGIVADEITAGVLQANLIRILGTTSFYWDAGNIYIVDPSDSNKQIRIGQYDGENYGIGFTRDGGLTWQTAMDFNGLNVTATGFSRVYVQEDDPASGGREINTGDMWVKSRPTVVWGTVKNATWHGLKAQEWQQLYSGIGEHATWQNTRGMTWQYLASNYLWAGLLETPEPDVYVWRDGRWVIAVNNALISSYSTQMKQNEREIAIIASATENLGNRVAESEASIRIQADQIRSKVSQTEFDALGNRVSEAESEIVQQADQISQRVTQGDFESYQQQTATAISSKVSQSDYNSYVQQTAQTISSKVAQADFNTYVQQTATTISSKVSQSDYNTYVQQTATELSSKVSSGSVISAINQSAEEVKIQANKITFEGLVTANSYFKILTDGSIEAKNANITGTFKTGYWTLSTEGLEYIHGDDKIFLGYRKNSVWLWATAGSADKVQVGTGPHHRVIVQGDWVELWSISKNASIIISAYDSYANISSSTFDYEDVCMFPLEGGSSWDTAYGNLGTTYHRWDVSWVRVAHFWTNPESSSRAEKHDIKPMADYGGVIDQLEPVSFVYNNDESGETRYGLIYEDTLPILPDICYTPSDGELAKGEKVGIDYTRLVPFLLNEVKSLRKRVKELEVEQSA